MYCFLFFHNHPNEAKENFFQPQWPHSTSSWEPFQLYSMHSCQQGSVFSCHFRVFAAEMTHLLPHHPSAAPLQPQSSASNRLFWPLYPSQRDGRILAEGLRHLIRFPNPIVLSRGGRRNSVSHYLIPPTPLFHFLVLVHTSGRWVKLLIFGTRASIRGPGLFTVAGAICTHWFGRGLGF